MVRGMLDEHKALLQVIYIEQARVVTSQDLHSYWFWHLGRVRDEFLRSKLRASEVSSQSHVLENPKLGTEILHQKQGRFHFASNPAQDLQTGKGLVQLLIRFGLQGFLELLPGWSSITVNWCLEQAQLCSFLTSFCSCLCFICCIYELCHLLYTVPKKLISSVYQERQGQVLNSIHIYLQNCGEL